VADECDDAHVESPNAWPNGRHFQLCRTAPLICVQLTRAADLAVDHAESVVGSSLYGVLGLLMVD
jgi:hypothetical protein